MKLLFCLVNYYKRNHAPFYSIA